MVNKIWKVYIKQVLRDLQENSLQPADKEPSSDDNDRPYSNPIVDAKQEGCKTIDRTFGHAFESFCKFVASAALKHSLIKKVYQVSPEDVANCASRLFDLNNLETRAYKHKKHLGTYEKYLSWRNGNSSYILSHRKNRCNLSILRKFASRKATFSKTHCEDVNDDRFKLVAPANHVKAIPIADVFSN